MSAYDTNYRNCQQNQINPGELWYYIVKYGSKFVKYTVKIDRIIYVEPASVYL
jgi:hypothetical protein